MKTLKLKVTPAMAMGGNGGVSLAHPGAEPGPIVGTGAGRMVVEISDIPDDVDTETVRATFAATADCTGFARKQRYVFRFAELGVGVMIRE